MEEKKERRQNKQRQGMRKVVGILQEYPGFSITRAKGKRREVLGQTGIAFGGNIHHYSSYHLENNVALYIMLCQIMNAIREN